MLSYTDEGSWKELVASLAQEETADGNSDKEDLQAYTRNNPGRSKKGHYAYCADLEHKHLVKCLGLSTTGRYLLKNPNNSLHQDFQHGTFSYPL